MIWTGLVAHMGERRSVDVVLVGKPEGKRKHGRPRRRWEEVLIRWIFRKWNAGVRNRSDWLRIRAGRGHL